MWSGLGIWHWSAHTCTATLVEAELVDNVLEAEGMGLVLVGSTGSKAIAMAATQPNVFMPSSWKGIKRVLIEYCTYPDSELGKATPHS